MINLVAIRSSGLTISQSFETEAEAGESLIKWCGDTFYNNDNDPIERAFVGGTISDSVGLKMDLHELDVDEAITKSDKHSLKPKKKEITFSTTPRYESAFPTFDAIDDFVCPDARNRYFKIYWSINLEKPFICAQPRVISGYHSRNTAFQPHEVIRVGEIIRIFGADYKINCLDQFNLEFEKI